MDEPTSGLDAFTASSIIKVLEGLAQEGRTVIATIHQSRSDLFPHFGNVLLLAKGGQVAYSGRGSNMLGHFALLGHTCPSTTNPADFALDVVSVNPRERGNEAASREKVEKLIRQFAAIQKFRNLAIQKEAEAEGLGLAGIEERDLTPMYIAMPILIRRGWLRFRRQPDLAVARIMQVVALGVFIGLFFAPLGTDYFSFQNRLGVIQLVLVCAFLFFFHWWYGGLLEDKCTLWDCCRMLANTHWNGMPFTGYGGPIFVASLSGLLNLLQEHADRAYSVNSFFFAYLILEIPFEIVSGLLFSLLFIAVGLEGSGSMYCLIALVSFCMVSCGESFGIVFNTFITDSNGFALNLASSLITIANVMAGEHHFPHFIFPRFGTEICVFR